MSDMPVILPDDPAALKVMIARLQAENARIAAENIRVQADIGSISATLRAHEALVQALQIQIARLKKQKFGASSERTLREIEQLELALEHLDIAGAAAISATLPDDDAELSAEEQAATPNTPRRRKPLVAESTPRARIVLDPGDDCPECGGTLRLIGEDVSEILELISAKLKLTRTARLKKSCVRRVNDPPDSFLFRLTPRSMAGPGLLAHVLVSKFDDHLPLYRQNEIFARMGASIPASTLVDWCGQGVRVLEPLVERIRANILASDRLHADDTPVRVLDPSKRIDGIGKGVKEGRIWTYVRDDRPWGSTAPPGAAYFFSVDRKGEHPQRHLAGFSGILQADAYSGFKALYAPDASGKSRIREAACWAHLRRDFFDAHTVPKSEIAREALDRIGDLYDIERQINGQSRDARRAIRQTETRPRVEAFKAWSEVQLTRIPGKCDLAKAFRYALNRWRAFTLFLVDGRVAIDNNTAERAIKPVVIGRKNFLFAGSDAGGETLASAMTIIETAKFNGLNPQAYLADIFARIHDHKINRIDELLPWNWKPVGNQAATA